ncbi:MAG TPA: DUF6377 domain-containing protein [Chryseosolibacter sp.]|nr:DUF6377 domain-containing protein [Chryseosolibacter sp.]
MSSLVIVLSFLPGFSQSRIDSIAEVLATEISHRDIYVREKTSRIDLLRSQVPDAIRSGPESEFLVYNELYHEYKTFIYDSAFRYARKLIATAYGLNDKSRIGYARVKLGFILISSGMFKETFDSLRVVEVDRLDDTTRVDYYRLLARAYSDLIVYNKDTYYKDHYRQLDQIYLDSALRFAKPDSYYHYYLRAVKELHARNYDAVIGIIGELFRNHRLSHAQQAVNYFDMAQAYRGLNNVEKTMEFTAMSSLADIRAATKETAAMYTLAKLMYENGDTRRAAVFIRQAVDDADHYGARQRKVEIGSILPLIASAELNDSEARGRLWISYGIGLSVLLLLVFTFVLILYKQMKKVREAELKVNVAYSALQDTNRRLEEANRIKEEYIGYYFSVNSDYLDRMESLRTSVEQKLNLKKYDDIRFLINSMNSKRDREDLYVNFDKLFLKMFPDFVRSFNSYLKPEERIVLKDGQLLNTELRIFALIRMGITDNEDIARILNYSVNTIYAYKTRIRNKSVLANEVFDDRIMQIRSVEA